MRVPWLRKRPALDVSWLTEDLALGAAPLDSQWEQLFALGITAVLEVRAEGVDDTAILEARGVRYRREEVADFEAPSLRQLYDMVQWIRARLDDRCKVLVHCRKGVGRSAMVACATLVALGFPLDVAYSILRSVRPNIALSPTQENALESLAVLMAAERRRGSS